MACVVWLIFKLKLDPTKPSEDMVIANSINIGYGVCFLNFLKTSAIQLHFLIHFDVYSLIIIQSLLALKVDWSPQFKHSWTPHWSENSFSRLRFIQKLNTFLFFAAQFCLFHVLLYN